MRANLLSYSLMTVSSLRSGFYVVNVVEALVHSIRVHRLGLGRLRSERDGKVELGKERAWEVRVFVPALQDNAVELIVRNCDREIRLTLSARCETREEFSI